MQELAEIKRKQFSWCKPIHMCGWIYKIKSPLRVKAPFKVASMHFPHVASSIYLHLLLGVRKKWLPTSTNDSNDSCVFPATGWHHVRAAFCSNLPQDRSPWGWRDEPSWMALVSHKGSWPSKSAGFSSFSCKNGEKNGEHTFPSVYRTYSDTLMWWVPFWWCLKQPTMQQIRTMLN